MNIPTFSHERAPVHDPGWASGDERPPLGVATWADQTPSTSATVYAWPFYTPKPMTVDNVFMALTTAQAGAEAMAGVYTNNGSGRPQTLIQDLGTLDLSATTGKRTWAANAAVNGFFWVLVWLKNVATQVTVKGASANSFGTYLPIVASTGLTTDLNASRSLRLADTYPASMPATAPAVVASNGANSIMVTVQAV